MTMLWLKTLTAPHKNELIHRRSWGDVVDGEIATFEWVTWWNESRLYQSLGYRTLAEGEAEFWEHHPSREITKHKANS
ncbi:transposase [Corynebacterium diphtheriae]|nr:transposase [Corynebacterium diphtheriae]